MEPKDGTAEKRYFQADIDAYQNGVNLDLRVRIALSLMNTSPMFHRAADRINAVDYSPNLEARKVARFALDVADALLAEATERGLTKPIGETSDIEVGTALQGERHVKYSLHQQVVQAELVKAHNAGVIPVAPGMPGGPFGRGGPGRH